MIHLVAGLLAMAQAAPETRWYYCVAAMPPEKIDYVTDVFVSTDPSEGQTSFTRTVGWGANMLGKMLNDSGARHELPTCFRHYSRQEGEEARARDMATWRDQGFTVKEVTMPKP